MSNGGFTLDKWHSNGANVVPQTSESLEVVELSEFSDTTVLGLRWLPKTDELMFKFQPALLDETQSTTKRNILSQIAKLFDPTGFLGPVIVTAKIIMQRTWKANIKSWDSEVPADVAEDWLKYQAQLPALTRIRIPRWLGIGPGSCYSLHGFSDASDLAYGAVVYLRIERGSKIECIQLGAKHRVAPVKPVTTPRLELCAAALLGELTQTIKRAYGFDFVRTNCWTDSSIVLNWMVKDPTALKMFVHNRIQSIRDSTADSEWRHVSSQDNPADVLSRGEWPEMIEANNGWWNGPEWLVRPSQEWPMSQPELTVQITKQVEAEMKSNWLDRLNEGEKLRPIQKAMVNVAFEMRGVNKFPCVKSDVLTRTSEFRRLIRRTAWILRFADNSRLHEERKQDRQTGEITDIEEERALFCWVRREQEKFYAVEFTALRRRDGIPKNSQLLRLNPFVDGHGLLRVGGRLENADLPYDQRHPLILPGVSHLAKLLI